MVLAVAYLVILTLMVVAHGKAYYIGPFYPLLFAAGAVAFERAARTHRAIVALPVVGTAVERSSLRRSQKPLMPAEGVVAYQRALGQDPRLGARERHELGPLPQHVADQHGWPELAATVARVRDALPAGERTRVCVFTSNYGEAAAIDFFGPAYGLPHAISGHDSYWTWGPDGCDFSTVILVTRGLTIPPDELWRRARRYV